MASILITHSKTTVYLFQSTTVRVKNNKEVKDNTQIQLPPQCKAPTSITFGISDRMKRSLPFAALSEGLDHFSHASLQLLALCRFLDKLQGPFLQFEVC